MSKPGTVLLKEGKTIEASFVEAHSGYVSVRTVDGQWLYVPWGRVRRVERDVVQMFDQAAESASASAQSYSVDMDVDHEGEAMDELEQWFVEAADFAGFDVDIIELSWAKADGELGIAVERQPFAAGYYDDDEWQDKEAYDAHRDTAGDLLSDNQHFAWYGEPDYVYFVAEEDVAEVVG